jgi:hypothetical protein
MGKSSINCDRCHGFSRYSVCDRNIHTKFNFTCHLSHPIEITKETILIFKNNMVLPCVRRFSFTCHKPVTTPPRPPTNLGKLAVRLREFVLRPAVKFKINTPVFYEKRDTTRLNRTFPGPCMLTCDRCFCPFSSDIQKHNGGNYDH